jgi:pre-mRNA-processing factor 6
VCVDDPHVYLATAKIFYKENKMEKFKRWVEKALLLNPRLGDAWAYLYL